MASRVRVAASACLVASGLFIGGAGGAIALADPGHGFGESDDRQTDDSVGDVVRRALGVETGNDQKGETAPERPRTRWGNGRTEQETPVTTKPEQPPTTKPSPCPEPPKPPGEPSPPVQFPGRDGGAIVALPRYKPPSVPDMQMPPEIQQEPGVPGGPAVLDAGVGAGAAAVPVGPTAPIVLPVIVAPPIGLGGGAAAAGGVGSPGGPPPGAPRAVSAEPPAGRVPPPANVGSNAAVPASYRIGYTEYLRSAGLPQVAALAVPGIAGILVLTGAGGLVGYRQAKAGHSVRAGGTARFMR